MTAPIRVVLAEDDETFRLVLGEHLRLRGFEVASATRVSGARALALESLPDVLVLDQKLPDGDGVSLAQELIAGGGVTKIILVTAHADLTRAIAATRAGVFDYLQKPLDLESLEDTIRRAARAARAERNVVPRITPQPAATPTPKLVGVSTAAVRLRAQLEAAARACPAPVLVTGETGAGKGLAARLIHSSGPRSGGPFVVVNCAAIPETMFEAELFGHERGAFTGATQARPGLFESAHGGTIVLDEIAEASPLVQSKLLRTLEDGVVRRVGAHTERLVNARVVATTNRDVEAMVIAGSFRRDLYYRTAVLRVDIPPLRERREDISLLVAAFLDDWGMGNETLLGKGPLDRLVEHDWPGNVRELRNVLQRWRAALHSGHATDILDLIAPTARSHPSEPSRPCGVPGIKGEQPPDGSATPTHSERWQRSRHPDTGTDPSYADTRSSSRPPAPCPSENVLSTLAEVEALHIRRALEASGNNRTLAAKRLGISRATLRRKLREEGRDG